MKAILEEFMQLVYIFLLVSAYAFGHGGEDHSKKEIKVESSSVRVIDLETINKSYEANVKPIFKKSCFDCHSNKTVFPWYYKIPGIKQIIDSDIKEAKSHLDFSNDFPFISHEDPIKDLQSISKSLEGGKMPPAQYLWLHSKANLSKEELEKVQHWIKKSLEILE